MSKGRSIRKNILFAACFTLLGLFGGYIVFAPTENILLKPEGGQFAGMGSEATSEAEFKITKDGLNRIIEGRTFFSLCGHSEPLNLGSFKGVSEGYLLDSFPVEQGWTIEDTGEKLLITKQINALCPKDEIKRHLGHFGNYVAVIKGPVGVDGGILEVTDIPLSGLPTNFREQAQQGMLSFSDPQSLLEALDSMDEIQE